jgi:hypothetical protein
MSYFREKNKQFGRTQLYLVWTCYTKTKKNQITFNILRALL